MATMSHSSHSFDEGDEVNDEGVVSIFRSKQANSETRWKDIKYLYTFLNQLVGDIFYKVIITKLLSFISTNYYEYDMF